MNEESLEPTVEDAMNGPNAHIWKQAMQEEVSGLIENDTWELAEHTPDKHVIDNKFVLKWKTDENGKRIRAKARLVVLGYKQKYGLDYEETYAPITRAATFRLRLSLFVDFKNSRLYQYDIPQAFLKGKLKEDIYTRQPKGFEDPKIPHTCVS